MQPRKLTAEECTFTVTIEQDDTPVRGNLMCTDEPDLDKAEEDAVLARLESGDETAWCGVIVTCTFPGLSYEGVDSIWGCTLSPDYGAPLVVEHHDMCAHALDDLNATIAAAFGTLKPLLVG